MRRSHPLRRLGLPDDEQALWPFVSSRNLIFRERPRGSSPKRGSRVAPRFILTLGARTDTYWRPSPFRSKATSPDGGGEQRMIRAHADIATGVKFGPSLADKNDAADDVLAAELLHAETPAAGIAPVARRAACLFVSHVFAPKACRGRRNGSATFDIPIEHSTAPGNCRSPRRRRSTAELPGRRRRSGSRLPARS